MRLSLELVVIAIVILVVALVVLTIFGGGMLQFGPLVSARNNCINAGKWSCQTAGMVPDTWARDPVGPNGETCAMLLPACQCRPNNLWIC
jgi:hypothetical protein